MFKRPQETVWDDKSASYPVLELPGVNCVQQIYRRIPMPKCDSNKGALLTSGGLLLEISYIAHRYRQINYAWMNDFNDDPERKCIYCL